MADAFDLHLQDQVSDITLNRDLLRDMQRKHPQFVQVLQILEEILGNLIVSVEALRGKVRAGVYFSAPIAEEYVNALETYNRELADAVDYWKTITYLSPDEEKDLKILASKFSALSLLLPYSSMQPANDLFCIPKTDPRWEAISLVTKHVQATNPTALEDSINKMVKMMLVSSAFLSKGLEYSGTMMRNIMTGTGVLYYGLRPEEAAKQAKVSAASPTVEFARKLWGINESQLASSVFDSLILNIPVSQLIYLPRVAAHVTQGKGYDILLTAKQIASSSDFVLNPEPHGQRVPVRIISPFRIPLLRPPPSMWSFCCGARESVNVVSGIADSIIFHIHGGGFISMSSRCHENYTRRWAIQTAVPVFSVDYRLAPEFPYPAGLDDVWQAYVWTIKHARKQLGTFHSGIDPRRIICAGDSAGGNLALGLCIRALESGVRPPNGLLLSYPSLNLNLEAASPSYLLSLEDMVLSHSMLQLCLTHYLRPGCDPKTDPLISPIVASDATLQRLPPVRILIGSKDPLKDDSLRLVDRLLGLGVNVEMKVFEGMPHGVLNYDVKFGLPEARQMVDAGTQYLKDLLRMAR